MKNSKLKKLHSILIVVDDHADDLNFVRHSKLLHALATRGDIKQSVLFWALKSIGV